MLNKSIKFLIENKLVAVILLVVFVGFGTVYAPFKWDTGFLPTDPVAVDAIPDIGENQQIIFTKWEGRSPQDIEDQITYPLTTTLLGIPGVKTIRSSSMFGFSSIYIIFDEDIEFYWSRNKRRVLCERARNPCWSTKSKVFSKTDVALVRHHYGKGKLCKFNGGSGLC